MRLTFRGVTDAETQRESREELGRSIKCQVVDIALSLSLHLILHDLGGFPGWDAALGPQHHVSLCITLLHFHGRIMTQNGCSAWAKNLPANIAEMALFGHANGAACSCHGGDHLDASGHAR